MDIPEQIWSTTLSHNNASLVITQKKYCKPRVRNEDLSTLCINLGWKKNQKCWKSSCFRFTNLRDVWQVIRPYILNELFIYTSLYIDHQNISKRKRLFNWKRIFYRWKGSKSAPFLFQSDCRQMSPWNGAFFLEFVNIIIVFSTQLQNEQGKVAFFGYSINLGI